MFLAFLCQIGFRYLFGWPTGWAFELSIITWVWVVLWGAAFVVTERDEIRFDIVYGLFPPVDAPRLRGAHRAGPDRALRRLPAGDRRLRRFMKVEKTAYLGIRFDWLYSIYLVFVVAGDRALRLAGVA